MLHITDDIYPLYNEKNRCARSEQTSVQFVAEFQCLQIFSISSSEACGLLLVRKISDLPVEISHQIYMLPTFLYLVKFCVIMVCG